MAWVESHTVLARHRKVLLLAHDLKISVAQTIGHLHVFWHAVLEQQEDGDLSGWPDDLIEKVALWEGPPGAFITHLRERGWVDGHLVHDWIDYVGPYLTKKYSSGNQPRLKEVWLKHGYKYGKGNGKFNKQKASVKRVGSEEKSAIPSPSLPNPSSPNPTKPEEEEERVPAVAVLSVEQVVEVWNATPRVRIAQSVTGPIRKQVQARIREHPDVSWFTALFERVSKSDFLTGQKKDFVATLDWVLGPTNLAKIDAGNFDNRGSPPGQASSDRCQDRVQRGNFLKLCGEPSVAVIRGRPLCQTHKEHHERKSCASTA